MAKKTSHRLTNSQLQLVRFAKSYLAKLVGEGPEAFEYMGIESDPVGPTHANGVITLLYRYEEIQVRARVIKDEDQPFGWANDRADLISHTKWAIRALAGTCHWIDFGTRQYFMAGSTKPTTFDGLVADSLPTLKAYIGAGKVYLSPDYILTTIWVGATRYLSVAPCPEAYIRKSSEVSADGKVDWSGLPVLFAAVATRRGINEHVLVSDYYEAVSLEKALVGMSYLGREFGRRGWHGSGLFYNRYAYLFFDGSVVVITNSTYHEKEEYWRGSREELEVALRAQGMTLCQPGEGTWAVRFPFK